MQKQQLLCGSHDDFIYVIKIAIIGNPGVGKSQLVNRLVDHLFSEQYFTDLGLHCQIKLMFYKGKEIQLQLWSLKGTQHFRSVVNQSFYKGVNGIILSYDIADIDSFEDLQVWIKGTFNNIPESDEFAPKHALKFLLGNKCDLKQRKVSFEQGQALADSLGIKFFETSAKENINIDECFKSITEQIIEERLHTINKRQRISSSYDKNGSCC